MDQQKWGRGFWLLIWIILYDEKLFPDLVEVKHFIDVITRNLPCDMCKSHVAEKIKQNSIMSNASREDLREFFIHVYSTTNTSGNKIVTQYDKTKEETHD
jgi:hypothetical protein